MQDMRSGERDKLDRRDATTDVFVANPTAILTNGITIAATAQADLALVGSNWRRSRRLVQLRQDR